MPHTLSIAVLGPLRVTVDGEPLAVDTRKAVALVAVLALHGEPLSRAHLAAMLWPEADPGHASGALRRTLSVLRTALGDRWADVRGGTIGLGGDGLEVDALRERGLWEIVRRHHRPDVGGAAACDACVDVLDEMTRLHRGAFMAGFSLRDSSEFDEWQGAAARDAERRLSRGLALVAEGRGRQGRTDEAIASAERWLGMDLLNEAAYRALMALHASAGDRAAAIRRYRDCVRTLDEQLSVEPLEETQALYRSIAAGAMAVTVTLDRLAREETAEMARLAAATGAGVAAPPSPWSEAGPGPGAAAETLAPAAGAAPGLPRAPLDSRLGAFSDAASQVLAAAAVAGGPFDEDLVRAISGRTDLEVVHALEELVAGGVIRELAVAPTITPGHATGGPYDFDHPQAREAAYARIGLARRRLLHRRAAAALVDRMPRDGGGGAAGEVARHLQLSGDDRRAAGYLEEAGRRSEAAWANAEALAQYRASAALDPSRLAHLRERMADLEALLGQYEAAVRDLEAAIAHEPSSNAEAVGRLERKLAALHRRAGRFALADAHAGLALARLPAGAADERVAALLERAMLAHRLGDHALAVRASEEALALVRDVPDHTLAARAHNLAGILARGSGDRDGALRHLRASLDLASGAGSLEGRVAALNNLALLEREGGRLDEAVEFAEAALRACVQQGDVHREAALRNNLADLLRATGRPDAALAQLREAVRILADITPPGELQPEIWRLVEW